MTNEVDPFSVESLLRGMFGETRKSILVVDDEPLNVRALHQVLGSDHEVFMATSGAQALTLCSQRPIDLVLLDVMMPEMDGHQVCASLKANPATRSIPIIFVTAQASPEDETRGLEAGAVDFITKPINASVVRARVRTHLLLKAQSDVLRKMALVDGLTGVPNRRSFDDRLALEWNACRRAQSSVSLLFIDVDKFKAFNDIYGHQAGDACLARLGELLAAAMERPRDFAARYGGEEFACVLPDTPLQGALKKAEDIRREVETLAMVHAEGINSVVTLSIGVASVMPDDGLQERDLIAAADKALYDAKLAGRNRIAGYSEAP